MGEQDRKAEERSARRVAFALAQVGADSHPAFSSASVPRVSRDELDEESETSGADLPGSGEGRTRNKAARRASRRKEG